MYTKVLFLIVSWLIIVHQAQTRNIAFDCISPTGLGGHCINFYRCTPLVLLIQQVPLYPDEQEYLFNSQCGIDGYTPKVCCVPQI
ncbi:phenoloxidase-activating enzyme 1-like [Aphidius gifuensis]|uniref:phenoloxidase-activating enzyme 1-like n=1 Tax=Aphidius gifuensis TaxID=684658 RepID=UPI001CDB641B|nr:phenoloxidase-activating enzyme 1-like [Aphidius gifuensis]